MTTTRTINRRAVTAGALGMALAAPFMRGIRVGAQEATPAGDASPLGYAVTRIHTLTAPELIAEMDAQVVDHFVPKIQALPGYRGYLLADSIDDPAVHFTVSLFDAKESTVASTEASAAWVSTLDPKFDHEPPVALDGDILIAVPPSDNATPTPDAAAGGFVSIRYRQSAPGADLMEEMRRVRDGFVPLIRELAGFRGYLFYAVPDGSVTISLFDSEESAQESNAIGVEWGAANTSELGLSAPDIYNGHIVFADLPILEAPSS